MFVMRWLLAAAALCEHVNQLVSVFLSSCLSVSSPCIIIRGSDIAALPSPPFLYGYLALSVSVPSFLSKTADTAESHGAAIVRRAQLRETDIKQ